MNDLRQAAQQALEALKYHVEQTRPIHRTNEAIDALRAALEKTVQEPVAMKTHGAWDGLELLDGLPDGACLYTAPPKRKPLTKEQLLYIYNQLPNWGMDMDRLPQGLEKFARAVERAHGITDPQVADRLARHGIPMPGDPK